MKTRIKIDDQAYLVNQSSPTRISPVVEHLNNVLSEFLTLCSNPIAQAEHQILTQHAHNLINTGQKALGLIRFNIDA